METRSVIDPTVPVKDLLARRPHLASALAARGLDTCCGGEHPLEQACRAKGLDLAEVVRDLESAHAAVEAHSVVPPTMSVREVLRRFPSTRAVLDRYGLADCGGADGPEEPIAWFATMHRLPLEDLLREVRAAASTDTASAPPSPAESPANAFRLFLRRTAAIPAKVSERDGADGTVTFAVRKEAAGRMPGGPVYVPIPYPCTRRRTLPTEGSHPVRAVPTLSGLCLGRRGRRGSWTTL